MLFIPVFNLHRFIYIDSDVHSVMKRVYPKCAIVCSPNNFYRSVFGRYIVGTRWLGQDDETTAMLYRHLAPCSSPMRSTSCTNMFVILSILFVILPQTWDMMTNFKFCLTFFMNIFHKIKCVVCDIFQVNSQLHI